MAPLVPGVLRHWKPKRESVLPNFHSFQTLADRLISREWQKTALSEKVSCLLSARKL